MVPRLDRLARNLSEGLRTIEELHAQGIHIRALTENLDTSDDSPNARLMLHMLLSLAEWERGRGDHTGPDQDRRGPRRGRGPDRRQAPGAGLREAAGRPGLPGNGGSVSVAARAFRVSRPTVRAVKERTPREIQRFAQDERFCAGGTGARSPVRRRSAG